MELAAKKLNANSLPRTTANLPHQGFGLFFAGCSGATLKTAFFASSPLAISTPFYLRVRDNFLAFPHGLFHGFHGFLIAFFATFRSKTRETNYAKICKRNWPWAKKAARFALKKWTFPRKNCTASFHSAFLPLCSKLRCLLCTPRLYQYFKTAPPLFRRSFRSLRSATPFLAFMVDFLPCFLASFVFFSWFFSSCSSWLF